MRYNMKNTTYLTCEVLISLGFNIRYYDNFTINAYSADLQIYVNQYEKNIYFCDCMSFDRWANSRDMVFENYKIKNLPIIIELAKYIKQSDIRYNGFRPYVLNNHWRSFKRKIKMLQIQ